MGEAKILVAEDDEVTRELIKSILLSDGYDVHLVPNGHEALLAYTQSPFDVVITDLTMPVMEGQQLVSELSILENPPIMVVETGEKNSEIIIEMMKKGISDYVLKPINREEFSFKINNAVKLAKLREAKLELETERQTRNEKQQDWNIMKERIAARSYDRFDKTLFSSLKASFNQGAGIGSLTSLISHMKGNIRKSGTEDYLVSKGILDLIFQNSAMAERALNTITEISNMLEEEFELSRIKAQDLFDALREVKDGVEIFTKINNHKIVFNDANYLNVHKEMLVNVEHLKSAFKELFINALKFSVPNSDIYIFTNTTVDRFYISIMNQPSMNITGESSIPEEYEKLIFEPFFRLVKFVYEDYDTIDFGLGLTMVEKIIRKNNGKIFTSTVTDKSKLDQAKQNSKINFEISFPLLNS
ncbi:MAG: response regulator [Leptospirales bacterium]